MSYVLYSMWSLIIIGLASLYYLGDTEKLLFILKPVTYFVENFLGGNFTYYEGLGFVSAVYKINIAKECAGIFFLIMILTLFVFSFLPRIKGKWAKGISFIGIIGVSYGITILANVSRIISIIFVMDTGLIGTAKQELLIHQSVGVVVYLFYLVVAYGLCTKLIKNWREKDEATL